MAKFINPFTDKVRMIFIELPSFNKEEDECESDFERWIYVLKNMETLQRLPFKARMAVFEKLEKIVDIASLSKAEGERKAKRENAQAMKTLGLDTDLIAQVTGLSIEEIEQL